MEDEMKPGRELDKRIAEEVMGWTGIATGNESGNYFGQSPDGNGLMYLVPNYSTDPSDAMRIVEYLKSKQVYWGADNGWSGHQYGYTVEFEADDVGNACGLGAGDTLPIAISMAALDYMDAVKEVEKGRDEAAKDFASIALSDDTPEGQSEGSEGPTDH